MTKSKTPAAPNWLRNLRLLMDRQGLNPRSLSLKAGLNATAVRDMLDGRSRFPRYDTVQSLAAVLQTTPALLMGDADAAQEISVKGPAFEQDLELLTEIITRLQEVMDEKERKLSPREFAAMAAMLYRRIQADPDASKHRENLKPQILDLMEYDALRQKRIKRA
jgi:transcriptional regulator with XRE-family HTH domain